MKLFPDLVIDDLVEGNIVGPEEFYKLHYYRQLVPNSEQTLPQGKCATCDPELIAGGGSFGPGHTWTSRNVAELIEGLGENYGGAVLATHSQSGPIGHHAVRILKQRGTLHYLKGLIIVEGTTVTLAGAGLQAKDFDNLPYMVLKGDYTRTSAASQDIVDAIIARREAGMGTAAVEYIKLDEPPNSANAWPAPLDRPMIPGIIHMMMLGSDEGYGFDSNDVMDVILDWSALHIPKMQHVMNCPRGPKNTKRRHPRMQDKSML